MHISKLGLLFALYMLLLFSCGKPSLDGIFYLSPKSQIFLSKNGSNQLQLEHFYIQDNDSLSVFGPPMIKFRSSKNRVFFRNKNYSASIKNISDSIMIYEYSKLSGEIDEVYFIKKSIDKISFSWYQKYCYELIRRKCDYAIDVSYFGLVFLVFDQEREKSIYIDGNLVILTTTKLNLESLMSKNYKLVKNGVPLNLKWDKYRNIVEESNSSTDGLIWGLNQGPYLDVLNKLGSSGEVLVFDLRINTSLTK